VICVGEIEGNTETLLAEFVVCAAGEIEGNRGRPSAVYNGRG
jgi:hypothetical protein